MKKIFIRENEPIEKLDSLFVWMVISVLLGARLGHVFFYDWAYYKDHLEEILLPVRFRPEFEFTGFQGLASHGAAIFALPCNSNSPSDGEPGGSPNPKKSSDVSVVIEPFKMNGRKVSVATMAFGKT